MDWHKENLKVVIKQLERIRGQYAKLTGAGLKDTTPEGINLNKLNDAVTVLTHISLSNHAAGPIEPKPSGGAGNFVDNWLDLALSELDMFNKHGSQYITSCSEALLKVHGVMNQWHADPKSRKQIYSRGEHRYGHKLIPRLGRQKFATLDEPSCGATEIELQLLADFQARVRGDTRFTQEIFGGNELLPTNDPSWWAIMRHYDQSYGTRMLDLTSGIFCALFFACAGWTGDVDENKDGRLYVFPQLSARGETPTPTMIQGHINDTNDRQMNSAASYFTIETSIDTARFRKSRFRNERELAQDGFFVWQSSFWNEMQLGQIFDIRIARDSKVRILQELYSIDYTADRIIRGSAGTEAQTKIEQAIGMLN